MEGLYVCVRSCVRMYVLPCMCVCVCTCYFACVCYLVGLLSGCVGLGLLVVLQPQGGTTVDYLLPEPHQTDERTQCTRHHETALQTVCQQVLSTGRADVKMSNIYKKALTSGCMCSANW